MVVTICHDYGSEPARSVTHLKISVFGIPFYDGGPFGFLAA